MDIMTNLKGRIAELEHNNELLSNQNDELRKSAHDSIKMV